MIQKIKKWWKITFRTRPMYVYVVSNTYSGQPKMLAFLEREEAVQYMADTQMLQEKPNKGNVMIAEIELL